MLFSVPLPTSLPKKHDICPAVMPHLPVVGVTIRMQSVWQNLSKHELVKTQSCEKCTRWILLYGRCHECDMNWTAFKTYTCPLYAIWILHKGWICGQCMLAITVQHIHRGFLTGKSEPDFWVLRKNFHFLSLHGFFQANLSDQASSFFFIKDARSVFADLTRKVKSLFKNSIFV